MSWRTGVAQFANSIRHGGTSRIAWLLACLHAAWFFLAIANMSPPSPGLGNYLDRGGWSSATLLAGRPFHFHYEALALKALVLIDLPATVSMIPIGCVLMLFSKSLGVGFYATSYVTAGLMLLGATAQWLLAGRLCERWMERQLPPLRRLLHRWAGVLIAGTIVAILVLAPTINRHSRAAGLKHGGISFR